MTEVRIEGAARLRRTLRQAGVDVKRLTAINRQAASIVADAATPTAPRRTGRLAASVRAGATTRAGVVRAGRSVVPYAGPIHWGWPARGIQPQPWIQQAAQATEDQWVSEYMDHVDAVLREVRGR